MEATPPSTPAPTPPTKTERRRFGDLVLGFFGVRLVIWIFAAKAFLPGPLLDPVEKIAYYHDEHAEILAEESARRSYVVHHQLPAWDPYWCGGVVGVANAGSLTTAPDFLLRLVYGTLAGRRLALFLFVLLGMEGTFRYARKNGASAIGAATGAIAFSTSGSFPAMLNLGWGFFFHYNLVPWAALGFEHGLRKKSGLVLGGAAVAWLLLSAGTYALPYTILILAFLCIGETGRALFRPPATAALPWWRPGATFVGVGVVGMMICALRLLPLFGLLATHTRIVMQKDQTGPLSVLAMVILPREHAGWGTGAGEYYVGTLVFGLAVFALLFGDRRAAKFFVIAVVFGMLACGEFTPGAPYSFLRKLPIFSQLRFPIRMLTLAGLFVALAATFGVTRIEDSLPRALELGWTRVRRWKASLPEAPPLLATIAAGVIAAAVAAWIGRTAAFDVVQHTTIAEGAIYNQRGPDLYEDEFRQSRGNRWEAQVWPFASRGSLHCFDENELYESPRLRGDLKAEEYPDPESPQLTVERVHWSPQQIVLRVRAPQPGTFLVNQNWAPQWRSDVGEVISAGGIIGVRVPAGDHEVTVSYVDWKLRIGAFITLLTIGGLAYFGGRRLVRRVRAADRWFDRLPKRLPTGEGRALLEWCSGARLPRKSMALVVLAGLFSVVTFFAAFGYLRTTTTKLRQGAKLITLPPGDGYGDERFGLSLETRKKIFAELAAAEPRARAEGKKSFPGPNLAWSADDHRGAFERIEIARIVGSYRISPTQALLVLDEGIREHWPDAEGKPLEPTTTPLHPRRDYGF